MEAPSPAPINNDIVVEATHVHKEHYYRVRIRENICKIKITNADEEEYRNGIYAKPNRFIWIEPGTYHDVTTTASNTTHARVANIAFLGGNININPSGTSFINITTTT